MAAVVPVHSDDPVQSICCLGTGFTQCRYQHLVDEVARVVLGDDYDIEMA